VPPDASSRRSSWIFAGAVVCVFFFLLGSRGLNEPDEGRYAEIAREMVETGDWLVPRIWYVPHLDKPPLTYWAVALSLKCFGLNEWAVRLPVALAGLSGALAAFLLARSLGGVSVARWSVLILISSPLYFVMARMLTTDIFLTQFIAWAVYCFWRSWRSLDGLAAADEDARGWAAKRSFFWQMPAWIALAGGFLTKGPIALVVPAAATGALLVYRRRERSRLSVMLLGTVAGLCLFTLLAVPWYWLVFDQLPGAFDFMVKNRLAGHALGTTVRNRAGSPFYFVGVLALGFLPWTMLLGWLWRRPHWLSLDQKQREGWLMLSAWVVFTFGFFSVNTAKLPAYILPLFPALAVMVAMRWPLETLTADARPPPRWLWRAVAVAPLWLVVGVLSALPLLFKEAGLSSDRWKFATPLLLLVTAALFRKGYSPKECAWRSVALSVLSLFVILDAVSRIEVDLKNNQTLKPLGEALRREHRTGDQLLIWARLPQGLPFYAYPAISAHSRPLLGRLPEDRMPFEFPGNRERLASLLVLDEADFHARLAGSRRILVVALRGTMANVRTALPDLQTRLIGECGAWELFINR
jgi:4-amino-4-deoxy-L-arabinose transferase-like glycosyltransferase